MLISFIIVIVIVIAIAIVLVMIIVIEQADVRPDVSVRH